MKKNILSFLKNKLIPFLVICSLSLALIMSVPQKVSASDTATSSAVVSTGTVVAVLVMIASAMGVTFAVSNANASDESIISDLENQLNVMFQSVGSSFESVFNDLKNNILMTPTNKILVKPGSFTTNVFSSYLDSFSSYYNFNNSFSTGKKIAGFNIYNFNDYATGTSIFNFDLCNIAYNVFQYASPRIEYPICSFGDYYIYHMNYNDPYSHYIIKQVSTGYLKADVNSGYLNDSTKLCQLPLFFVTTNSSTANVYYGSISFYPSNGLIVGSPTSEFKVGTLDSFVNSDSVSIGEDLIDSDIKDSMIDNLGQSDRDSIVFPSIDGVTSFSELNDVILNRIRNNTLAGSISVPVSVPLGADIALDDDDQVASAVDQALSSSTDVIDSAAIDQAIENIGSLDGSIDDFQNDQYVLINQLTSSDLSLPAKMRAAALWFISKVQNLYNQNDLIQYTIQFTLLLGALIVLVGVINRFPQGKNH